MHGEVNRMGCREWEGRGSGRCPGTEAAAKRFFGFRCESAGGVRSSCRATGVILGLVAAVAFPRAAGGQEPPILLDTLRVQVGSRLDGRFPAMTRSVTVLERSRWEALPVRTLAELLRWVAGVEVLPRSPAQADLSLRGSSFEQLVVLVDGVRVSDPQTGHHDLNLTIPLDRIERVEVLRGAASALYGADAMGGVVNVVTRQAASGWHARMEAGSWATGRGAVGVGWRGPGELVVGGGGEWTRSDGHRPGTDYEILLMNLKAGRPWGSGWFRGDLGLARRDFGAQDFYAPYPSFERTRTYTASLTWVGGDRGEAGEDLPKFLGPPGAPEAAQPKGAALVRGAGGERSASAESRGAVEFGVSLRRHEDEFTLVRTNPALYRNQHTSHVVGAGALGRFSGWGSWRVAVGGEAYADLLESNRLGEREELRGAVYTEAVWSGGQRGVMSFGLRQDWHEGFEGAFSPAFSASYTLPTGVRFRGALGHSFRVPTFTERYYRDPANRGREDLAVERAWSTELGLDWVLSARTRVGLTGFRRRAEGLIDWARPVGAPPSIPWETRNVREATFLGAEGEALGEGPLGIRWAMGGSVLSVDARDAGGFVSKYALRPLAEKVAVSVQREFAGRLLMGLHGQRGRRKGEKAHLHWDVRTRLRWEAWSLHLDATNLTDERYSDVSGAPAPGRALFVGLERGLGW